MAHSNPQPRRKPVSATLGRGSPDREVACSRCDCDSARGTPMQAWVGQPSIRPHHLHLREAKCRRDWIATMQFVAQHVSPQLAVLATPSIDPGKSRLPILTRLTFDTGANNRQCRASPLGDRLTAEVAIFGSIPGRHPGSRRQYGIPDRILYLILYGAVARPAVRHVRHQGLEDPEIGSQADFPRLRVAYAGQPTCRASPTFSGTFFASPGTSVPFRIQTPKSSHRFRSTATRTQPGAPFGLASCFMRRPTDLHRNGGD